ncbi:hypothetical protein [Chitinimonas sp.]|uniref:hypothetical protein n=1 Tax=Chitinimonas sp. TaxID=1934313 RepID=UPI0035AE7707
MTIQTSDEGSVQETLRAYHLGLSGSEYYGPDEAAHRAGRLVQHTMLLEREQLQALAELQAQSEAGEPGLLQRVERQFRRLVGLGDAANDEPANSRSRLRQFAA